MSHGVSINEGFQAICVNYDTAQKSLPETRCSPVQSSAIANGADAEKRFQPQPRLRSAQVRA